QPAEDLLVLDLLRARGAHALHDEIETLGFLRIDGVVVDRGAQVFARAGADTAQDEAAARRGQRQRGRTRPVRHAHDDRAAPAVLEELLDRVAQRGRLPEAAEHTRVVGEAAYQHRFVDGALERATDEGGDAGRGTRDDTYRAGLLGDW